MTDGRPPAWRTLTAGYRWTRRRAGLSGADVFALVAPGRPALFAKSEATSPFSEVAAEAMALRWLGQQDIACARLLDATVFEGRTWLLTAALPGCDMGTARAAPAALVAIAAEALRRLHALPAKACPFDRSLSARILEIRARLAAGTIEAEDFADESGAERALDMLLARAPAIEELVVTHGDATLSNMMIADGAFAGFIDCGRVGRADRYQDLALCCDSIEDRFGGAWIDPFLTQYGIERPDRHRLAFYERFDLFF